MSLIKEYFELTNKYKKEYGKQTLVLLQCGSFMEVYAYLDKKTNKISGSNIEDFSRICDLNIVEKNVCVGDNSIVMAGFKDIMIEKYIKKLQEQGVTTVVYTQDEQAKNTTRSLAGIFSPGTYFSEDSSKLTNNTCCIWIELVTNLKLFKGKFVIIGVSNVDIYTGKSSIFQFQESYVHNPTTYDELERFISIYQPSETIIISNLPNKEIDDIINYTNIQSKLIHKVNTSSDISLNTQILRTQNCEKQNYQKEILNRFYDISNYDVFIQQFKDIHIATQSFCFLLDFIYQHNPSLITKISEPIFENCNERLILANHSLKQLNVIDDHNYTGKYSSVSKMLNSCLTPMGRRKFHYQFLNPTTNTTYLQREYDITEHLLNKKKEAEKKTFLYKELRERNVLSQLENTETENNVYKELREMKDLSKWERQVFLKKISPRSFCQLYKNLGSIKELYNYISDDPVFVDYLSFYEKDVKLVSEYCQEIITFLNNHFELELAREIDQTQNFEVNFISVGVDNELDLNTGMLNDYSKQLESIRFYLNSLIEKGEKKGASSEYVKLHETEKNSFSLVCTSRRCKLLEGALPDVKSYVTLKYGDEKEKEFQYIICKKDVEFPKQSASNNFIVDETITKLCKNITSVKIYMKDLITKVFYKITEQFEGFQDKLETIINFVTYVDIAYAKMTIANKYSYCKPTIFYDEGKSFVEAKDLRHCLIEQIQNNEIYVSNDVELGNGKTDGILLYGTNAVGKTSLIRALGIAIIMAQSGLYVPCSSFVYKPYKYIFTRILGNDNIFKGLSTFAVEMSELRTILRLADENSLILGDELCSGTENTSAVSIFVAGIQKLYEKNSSFIFATHLHEIVDYEEITGLKSVTLKHMEVFYDKEREILVYDRKLKDGPGNSMYGLEVCKSLNLPNDFLEAAYQIRQKYNPENSASILSLKGSHYNKKKIMGLCENCGTKMGTEVHHLEQQKEADEKGIIRKNGKVFHKNKLANLKTLCEDCHRKMHESS